MAITKRQVLAVLALYSVVRGVVDELRPADEQSEESASYDKISFNAVSESIKKAVDKAARDKTGMEVK